MIGGSSLQRVGDALLGVEAFDDSSQVAQYPLTQLLRSGEVFRYRVAALSDFSLQRCQSFSSSGVLFREARVRPSIVRVAKVEKRVLCHLTI